MASETLSWVDRRAANKRAKVGLNFLFDCSEDAEQLRSLRSSSFRGETWCLFHIYIYICLICDTQGKLRFLTDDFT
jgi:hypothetical protein